MGVMQLSNLWKHNFSASICAWVVLATILHPILAEFGLEEETKNEEMIVTLSYETVEIETIEQYIDGTIEIELQLPDETEAYLLLLELFASYEESEVTDFNECDKFFIELVPKFDVNTTVKPVQFELEDCEDGVAQLQLRPFFNSEPQELQSEVFEQQKQKIFTSNNGYLTLRISVDVERGSIASQDDGETINMILQGRMVSLEDGNEGGE
jgi:hypothetical protein